MDDREQDLRATSDQLLEDAEELRRVEREKRTERPGSHRFDRLADRVERLSRRIGALAGVQRDLGADLGRRPNGHHAEPIDRR